MGSCDLHKFSDVWDCWCPSRHGCRAFRRSCHSCSPWHNLYRPECVKVIQSSDDLKCTFKIALNVNPFTAQELHVKVKNESYIIIEGKKQMDPDKELFCACSLNEFKRSYKIPRHFDPKQAQVILYSDHMLKISIPGMMPASDDQVLVIQENSNKYDDADKSEPELEPEEEPAIEPEEQIETEKLVEEEIQETEVEN